MDPARGSTFPDASANTACWERLESAWRARSAGAPPDWADFLPPPGEPCDRDWIVNLIQIDIESRVKAGLSALLSADYFNHPRLRDDAVRLTDEQQAELVAWEYHQRWRAGGRAYRADYLAAFPHLAGRLAGLRPLSNCPACQTRVEWPSDEMPTPQRCSRCGHEVDPGAASPKRSAGPTSAAPVVLPGYEVLGEIGRGGMGVVYKARQLDLNRAVALKLVRSGDSADPAELARFRVEAETVAQLQHPNIVQIHAVAHWRPPGSSDPLPCVVMEYVDGSSLDRRIADRPQSPTEAAWLVETLARAVDWMHRRGVIHRDLKPANILLSGERSAASGEPEQSASSSLAVDRSPLTAYQPKIADFGLAKSLDAGGGRTRTGDILGTPNYMSPEQAAGDPRAVGPSADIYGLGAVLYTLLTGRPPFRGETSFTVIEKVLRQPPTPPRQLQPGLPRDLETITLKCLEKTPALRYATAADLADDLDRFLKGEPILARPVGRFGRAWRWCRREAKLVAAAVALVVMLLAVAGFAMFALRQQRLDDERFEQDVSRLGADLELLGSEEISLVPQLDEARRKRLEELAATCGRLLAHKKHPELRRKQAEVHEHLGTIYELLGRTREAEAAYVAALADADGPRDTARVRQRLGDLQVVVGRFDEAEANFRTAAVLLPEGDLARRPDLAEALRRLGRLEAMTGRLAEGEATLRRALALALDPAAGPTDAVRQLHVALTQSELAGVLVERSRLDEAARLCDAAVAFLEPLATPTRAAPNYRVGLARSLNMRATVHQYLGRERDSTADLVRVFEIYKQLADDYTHRLDYRLDLAAALHNVARDTGSLPYREQIPTMEKRYLDAINLHRRIATEFPDQVENLRRLATGLNSFATWLTDKTDNDGSTLSKIILMARSADYHRQSEEIWVRLCADHPTVTAYQSGLATSHLRRGIVLNRQGRYDEAESRYREAIAVQSPLAEKFPEATRYPVSLAGLNNNLGVIRDRRDDLAGAEKHFRLAVKHARHARTINPAYPVPGYILAVALPNVAEIVLRRNGDYLEAADLMLEVPRQQPSIDHNQYARLFEQMVECVKQARNDAAVPRAERESRARQCEEKVFALARAMAASKRFAPAGVLKYLQSWPALAELRERDAFKALVRDLEDATKK